MSQSPANPGFLRNKYTRSQVPWADSVQPGYSSTGSYAPVDSINRSPRKLFQQPRDSNITIENHRKITYIPPLNRLPTPKKKLFLNGREDTKMVAHSVPQINLNKLPRSIAGIQSPVISERKKLFTQPRNSDKYADVDGSKPREIYNQYRPPRHYFEDNVLPNSPKLFQKPRTFMDYDDVEGSHSKVSIDQSKPARDNFFTIESNKKDLFQQPRDIMTTVEKEKHYIPTRPPPKPVESPYKERNLFVQPRDVMKYGDVQGSHPTKFYKDTPAKYNPTYCSKIFAD